MLINYATMIGIRALLWFYEPLTSYMVHKRDRFCILDYNNHPSHHGREKTRTPSWLWNAQSATRKRDRPAVCKQFLLRCPRSSPSPLRDDPWGFKAHVLKRTCTSIWHVCLNVLPFETRVSQGRASGFDSCKTRSAGSPQDYFRDGGVCKAVSHQQWADKYPKTYRSGQRALQVIHSFYGTSTGHVKKKSMKKPMISFWIIRPFIATISGVRLGSGAKRIRRCLFSFIMDGSGLHNVLHLWNVLSHGWKHPRTWLRPMNCLIRLHPWRVLYSP